MKKSFIILLLSNTFLFSEFVCAQKIAAGGRHSLLICADSTVQAWGYNGYGQLGNGNIMEQHTGTQVIGLTKIVQVAGGLFHSLFIKADSTVWACGRNLLGPLGDGTNTDKNTPVQVNGLSGIIQAAGGGEHSLFLKSDGTVWACGANSSGQLGDGTRVNKNSPVKVNGLTGIIQVAAGAEFSLFLKNDSTVWSCGHNGFGQYGNNTNTSSNVPVQISNLSGIVQVSAGEWHSLFVKNNGTVFSSGRNQYGQLGDGTIMNNQTAGQINSLSGILKAEAGGIHSVFVKNDGSVWACGLNSGGNNDGQLGDGTSIDRHLPVQVISAWGSGNIIHAEATREHSLFLRADGVLWAAGRNNYGQLGYGSFTTANSNTPVLAKTICSSLSTSNSSLYEPKDKVIIYPNPFSTQTTIQTWTSLQNETLSVFNSNGLEVKQIRNVFGEKIIFHRDNLPSGLYFIRLTGNHQEIKIAKLLIIE